MKPIYRILAVAAVSCAVLAAAGCAGAKASPKTLTSANWNARISSSVEKNFEERWLNNKEVAKYSVSFEKGNNGTYELNYENGSYVTEFGMTVFDRSQYSFPEDYMPTETADIAETVYYYKTSLKVDVTFSLNDGSASKTFNDSTETVCYFRLAGDNLQPVYSKQIVKNTAPNTSNAKFLEVAYVQTDGVFETFYNFDCSQACVKHTNNLLTEDNTSETRVGLKSDPDYSVFDNSQLRQAIRAMNLSGGGTHTFNVLNTQNAQLQTVDASCGGATELNAENEEQKGIIDALDACAQANPDYLFFDKGEGENAKQYRYNAVTAGIHTDTPMKGPSVTCWYSTVENGDINATKCVLLKISTPLSFGLGTLNYTLNSLNLEKIS